MPALYRVFPALPGSAADEPGGALYIPPQQSGRIDNPGLYRVFYASDAEAGAIAEAFGRFPEWTPAILEGSPGLPGSVPSLLYHGILIQIDAAACCARSPAGTYGQAGSSW